MTSIRPAHPEKFSLYCPISVRYADIDAMGHVNNVKVLEYVEMARNLYYQRLGIWDGKAVADMGLVVASIKIDYLRPIFYGQALRVGLMTTRVGGKSIRLRFQVEDDEGSIAFARGEVIVVAYDQAGKASRLVPDDWRENLAALEGQHILA